MGDNYPQDKLTIIGGGIVAAIETYFAYLSAKENKSKIRVTIYEKNSDHSETTTAHIVPSLTPDEILSVVPRGQELVEKLQLLFSEPGGIQVTDVKGINNSQLTDQFVKHVQLYDADEKGHHLRTKTLFELGKMSMNFWQTIYNNADSALKKILEESNFNPCCEPKNSNSILYDGYRVDLIYNMQNAKNKANNMKAEYEQLGYKSCKILTPKEVIKIDPYLTIFCESNSIIDTFGERHWKDDAIALWRPGGCIDTRNFLPKFYSYLKEMLGKYTNNFGKSKDCFRLRFGINVTDVIYNIEKEKKIISGLRFFGGIAKHNKHKYKRSEYVFCPGEAVGTLSKFGFDEPPCSGFSGASLMLNILIPIEKLAQYEKLNHYMEVHQEGVVLSWQARFRNNKISIGVAGTKAFYADQTPHKEQEFAKNRNLLQLNVINDVLPELITLALGRNTKDRKLGAEELKYLEDTGVAERWVGIRAVAYDGFPTLGVLYSADNMISNARCTTHLGSGGASFAPASVFISRTVFNKQAKSENLIQDVLEYSDSRRRFDCP